MLKFKIKATRKDGKVVWYFPTRKSKLWPTLKHEFEKSGQIYIKVIYGKDLYNHGTFLNNTSARQFVNECTEPALLKYAENWYK